MPGLAPACIKYVPPLMRLMPAHALATMELMSLGIPFTFARYAVTDAFVRLPAETLKELSTATDEQQAKQIVRQCEKIIFAGHATLSERYNAAVCSLTQFVNCGTSSRYRQLNEHHDFLYGLGKQVIPTPRGFQARRLGQRSAFGFFMQHVQMRNPISLLISDFAFYRHALRDLGGDGHVDEAAVLLAMDGHFDDDAVARDYVSSISALGELVRQEGMRRVPLPVLSTAAMLDVQGSVERVFTVERFMQNFTRARKYLHKQRLHADAAYDAALDVFGVDAWDVQKEILDLRGGFHHVSTQCCGQPKRCARGRRKSDRPKDPVSQHLQSAEAYFGLGFNYAQTYACMASLMPTLFGPLLL